MALTKEDGQQDQGVDGKFIPSQPPSSKPSSSKNKKPDGRGDERAMSQNSKYSKPPNQSANDTIDATSQGNTKVGVKS
jgi:hypothetical protein